MIVDCPQCSTKFKIATDKVSSAGTRVRCSKCKHVFSVFPDTPSPPVPAPPAPSQVGSSSLPPHPPMPASAPLPGAAMDISIDLDNDDLGMPEGLPPARAAADSRPAAFPLPAPPPPDSRLDADDLFGDFSDSGSFSAPLPADRFPTAPVPPPASSIPAPAQVPDNAIPGVVRPEELPAAGPEAGLDDPFAGLDLGPGEPSKPVVGVSAPPSSFSADDPFADLDLSPGPSPSAASPVSPPPAAVDPFATLDFATQDEKPAPAASGESDDDPFADIDLSPAGQDALAQESPFGDDLFGDLDGSRPERQEPIAEDLPAGEDIFAKLDLDNTPPPLPGLAPMTGGAAQPDPDDIFGSIQLQTNDPGADSLDLEQPEPAGDSFGDLPGFPSSSTPTGLQIDAEGNVVGSEPPPPPAPTKDIGLRAMESERDTRNLELQRASLASRRARASAPMAETLPAGQPGWGYKLLFGFFVMAVLFFAFVTFRHGGKPDLTSWSTYVEAFVGSADNATEAGDMRAVGVSSTTYPNRHGDDLVVLWGEVENLTDKPKDKVVVTAQLLDERGKPLQQLTVPAGFTFDPRDVVDMLSAGDVAARYRQRYARQKPGQLEPGKRLPFMVVMAQHPAIMTGVRLRLAPGMQADPLAGLPRVAPPRDSPGQPASEHKPEPAVIHKRPRKTPPTVREERSGTVVRMPPKKLP